MCAYILWGEREREREDKYRAWSSALDRGGEGDWLAYEVKLGKPTQERPVTVGQGRVEYCVEIWKALEKIIQK